MTLRDPQFEKAVRAKVRDAVGRSPSLRKEFRRVRQTGRTDISQPVLRVLLTAGFAACLTKIAQPPGDLDSLLALITIWCTAFAIHHANRLRFELFGAPALVVLALQPIPDARIFEHQWQVFARRSIWLLVDMILALAITFAHANAGLAQWLAALPCALALWMSAVSVATSFVALRPAANYGLLSSGLFLVIIAVVISSFYRPETVARALHGASGPFYLIPPFGWLSYAIRESVLGPALLPLFLLAPIGLLAPALHRARKRLARQYQLFAADPPTPNAGVEDPDITTLELDLAPDADQTDTDDPAATESSAASSAASSPGSASASGPIAPGAEAAAASTAPIGAGRRAIDPAMAQAVGARWSSPLPGWSGPGSGWLERRIAAWLTPREREIAEFMTAGNTGWTLLLRRSAILILAALFAGYTLGPSAIWLCYVGLYFGATTGLPFLGTGCVGFTNVSLAGVTIPAYALLPLGYREVSGFLIKVGVARTLAFTPVALVAGPIVAHLVGMPWTQGLLIAAKLMIATLAWQPMVVTGQFSSGTNDSRGSLSRAFMLLLGLGPLMLGTVGATVGSLFAPPLLAGACLLGAAVLSWLTHRIYGRLYDRNRFDLMHGQAQ